MQPTGQRRPGADRSRLLGQGQERRLERILGQMMIAENAPADAEHHRSMPPDQKFECGRIAVPGEAREQPLVGQGSGRVRIDLPADDAQHACQTAARHGSLQEVSGRTGRFDARRP